MLTGYRIADPEFCSSIAEMMSGEGAYLFGGRWNSKGSRVVYLGSSLAQAAMELLVHIGWAEVLNDFVKLEVSFDPSLVQHINLEDLPADWDSSELATSVQAAGDDWVANKSSLILQVPSAAVNGEYNYLFNPDHPDAAKARYSEIQPYNFDPRLQK